MRPALFLTLLFVLAACDTSGLDAPYVVIGTFDIDPRGTYLRTNQDTANAPTTIDLEALGVQAGDSLFVRILGEVDLDPAAASNGVPGAASFLTTGVFSTSQELLAQSVLNRVPGAVDMPGEVQTGPTSIGTLPNDIEEDVLVNRGRFRIPSGVTTLFLSPIDQYYSDNTASSFTATLSIRRNR